VLLLHARNMTQASSSQGQLKLPLPIIAPIQECIHSWLGGGWGGGQPANTGAFVSSTGSVVNETPKYNAMAGVTSTTSFSQVVPPPSGQDTGGLRALYNYSPTTRHQRTP